MLKIDDYSFDKTAEAVHNINPATHSRYATPADLRDFMVSMARHFQENTPGGAHKVRLFGIDAEYETTSFSTSGFQLTFFPSSHGGHTCCIASVSASLANAYLREVNTQLDKPWVALD